MNSAARHSVARRGLTLVELLIALMITAMMGLAIGSMMTMVGSASGRDSAERTALLRAHAGQVRLRAYMDNALSILQHDEDSQATAIWLYDKLVADSVNLREVRLITVADGLVTVEWVAFPENWSQAMQDSADVVLPGDSDFFAAMAAQRALGQTRTTTLLNHVQDASWALSAASPQDAERARLTLTLDAEGSPVQALYAFGLKDHTIPD